ncbi:MAG: c-type cytochrome [Vicinamibacteria bacterium]
MTCGRKLAGVLSASLLLGLLAAWSGLVPLAASSGHWPLTEWFLHFTMHRTVKVRSSGIRAPHLEDGAMALRGAGHFEIGCRPCHGSPGTRPPTVLRYMTPPAPTLPELISEWEPEELFWIVRHGIKFTGMPGWPSQKREDEVWDMVAFLRHLPNMDPAEYRDLAGLDRVGPSEAPGALATCARCHGIDGKGREGAFPRLAGQSPTYLYCALEAYDEGRRFSGTMETVASALSDGEKLELARYYGDLAPRQPVAPSHGDAVESGEEIALWGVPQRRVPSCSDCHGPTDRSRKPNYPRLAGQNASYLELQLQLFHAGRRGGSPYAHLMHPVAKRLTKDQRKDVALYYASLVDDGGRGFEDPAVPGSVECGFR